MYSTNHVLDQSTFILEMCFRKHNQVPTQTYQRLHNTATITTMRQKGVGCASKVCHCVAYDMADIETLSALYSFW